MHATVSFTFLKWRPVMSDGADQYCSVPLRFAGDNRLTGTEARLLAAIAYHDRGSLIRGGRGCYATNKTLADLIGADYTTVLKLLKRLEEFGYIRREAAPGKRRLTIIRVVPDSMADIESCSVRQLSGQHIGKSWPVRQFSELPIAGDLTSDHSSKAGEGDFEQRRKLPKTAPQYIPLKGERYKDSERPIWTKKTPAGAEALRAWMIRYERDLPLAGADDCLHLTSRGMELSELSKQHDEPSIATEAMRLYRRTYDRIDELGLSYTENREIRNAANGGR